ncbi:MAG TPA: alpha/beta fold hydrolase [Burkholderiales bacterium]
MSYVLGTLRMLSIGAFTGYLVAGAALWLYQRHLIFEPAREMQAAPRDFSFPVLDTTIALPAAASGTKAQLHGWWIAADRADARVVLYLHGNDGNVSTSMREIAPLRALGYAVFVIDYRGYGQSAGAFPSERSVYEDAEAAWHHLVADKGIDPRRLYLYGHSLGGAVAIELATRHPEAAGLIVESSFTSIYDMARLEKPYKLFPVKLFLNQRFDSIDKVERLALPVLFIHGTADEVVPFSMGEQLYRRSGGAKRFVAIEGGRHDDNAVAGGQAFLAALRNFVADTQRAPGAAAQPALNSSSM